VQHGLQRPEIPGDVVKAVLSLSQLEQGAGIAVGDHANSFGWHLGKSLRIEVRSGGRNMLIKQKHSVADRVKAPLSAPVN
jgi:hypothetical protein